MKRLNLFLLVGNLCLVLSQESEYRSKAKQFNNNFSILVNNFSTSLKFDYCVIFIQIPNMIIATQGGWLPADTDKNMGN